MTARTATAPATPAKTRAIPAPAKKPRQAPARPADARGLAPTGQWPAEAWKAVPGLAGYEASSWGRVRSIDRTLPINGRWGIGTRRYRGRILRPKMKPNGCGGFYPSISTDGGSGHQVNRCVCAAFHGPAPTEDHEAAHGDGNTLDNRPGNLRWATHVENEADKIRHETAPKGSRNPQARLTEECIPEIISRYAAGESSAGLAADHGVCIETILLIAKGKTWAHVKSDYRPEARQRAQLNMYEAPR